jgi:hypothetical protein
MQTRQNNTAPDPLGYELMNVTRPQMRKRVNPKNMSHDQWIEHKERGRAIKTRARALALSVKLKAAPAPESMAERSKRLGANLRRR